MNDKEFQEYLERCRQKIKGLDTIQALHVLIGYIEANYEGWDRIWKSSQLEQIFNLILREEV